MNTSRQRLYYLVLGLAGVMLVVFVFVKTFVNPWQEQQRALETAEKDYEGKRFELLRFEEEKKSLERYRLLGLPANVNQGGSEYAKYLKTLLQGSGLTIDDLQGPSGGETKTVGPAQAKKAGHVLLSYQVRARGDWSSVASMFDKFRRTPLLHRIRSFALERPSSTSSTDKNGKLSLSMTVEALVVNKSQQRPGDLWGFDYSVLAADALAGLAQRPTGWAMLLRGQAILLPEARSRSLASATRFNPFVGEVPPAPPPVAQVATKSAPELDVREYVELVMIDEAEQKASLRNQLAKVGEQRLAYTTLAPKFPYDTFRILDEDFEEEVLRGKVLRVDRRDVYFQVGQGVYAIHVGQTLADAMKTPLSKEKLESLGLRVK